VTRLIHETAPTLSGPYGRAWEVDLDHLHAMRVQRGENPPPRGAEVCNWVVHAPQSHPYWPVVVISCITLRDIPGVPPAVISLPGATHEVYVFALNPDYEVDMDKGGWAYLTPANFVGQFIEANDTAAAIRVRGSVHEILAGTLNPDSDGRSQWVQRYSDSNIQK